MNRFLILVICVFLAPITIMCQSSESFDADRWEEHPEAWPTYVEVTEAFKKFTRDPGQSRATEKTFDPGWYRFKSYKNGKVRISLCEEGLESALGSLNGNCGIRLEVDHTNFYELASLNWECIQSTDSNIRRSNDKKSKHEIIGNAHGAPIRDVSWIDNGSKIVSLAADNILKVWDANSGLLLSEKTFDNCVLGLDIQLNRLAITSGSNCKVFHDLPILGTSLDITAHYASITDVEFIPNSPRLATSSWDKRVKIWDLSSRKLKMNFEHSNPVSQIALYDQNTKLLSVDVDGNLLSWDILAGKYLGQIISITGVASIHKIRQSKSLIVLSTDNRLIVHDIEDFKVLNTVYEGDSRITALDASRNGDLIALGFEGGEVKVWSRSSQSFLATFLEHNGPVTSIDISRDNRIVTGGADRSIKVIDVGIRFFIRTAVREKLDTWQKRGKYEKIADYKNRVTEKARKKMLSRFVLEEVTDIALNSFRFEVTNTTYDADGQLFKLDFANSSSILLKVPRTDAPSFDKNLNQLRFANTVFGLDDRDQFVITSCEITNPANQKTYSYQASEDKVFQMTKVDLILDPLDIDIRKTVNVRNDSGEKISILSDVDVNIPKSSNTNPDAIAIVIGNKNYPGDGLSVDFAQRDAFTFSKYLETVFGILPGNIFQLQDATKATLEVWLGNDDLPGRIKEYIKAGKTDFIFFYSGHGAPDPDTNSSYIVPIDGDPSNLKLSAYSLSTLYDNIEKLNARSVQIIIDACFSGASGGSGEMMIKYASPIGITVRNPMESIKNGCVITASSNDQLASWYPEKGHGLLTYFYLKAIQGGADLNKDDVITLSEVSSFLTSPTKGLPYWARRLHSRNQTPQVFGDKAFIVTKIQTDH